VEPRPPLPYADEGAGEPAAAPAPAPTPETAAGVAAGVPAEAAVAGVFTRPMKLSMQELMPSRSTSASFTLVGNRYRCGWGGGRVRVAHGGAGARGTKSAHSPSGAARTGRSRGAAAPFGEGEVRQT
jgi:hypothetical protein